MSKKPSKEVIEKYSNDLKKSAFFRGVDETKDDKLDNKSDVRQRRQTATSDSDVSLEKVPVKHIAKLLSKPTPKEIDLDVFTKIITGLLSSKVSTHGTPVRATSKEKELIQDFLLNHLYQQTHITPNQIGESKLYRLALTYMITNHKDEFMFAIQSSLQKPKNEYDF
jgi:hypothetical protein